MFNPVSFNLALAPGRSFPDMPRNFVTEDGKLLASKLGNSSVVGVTEATKFDATDFGKAFPRHHVVNPNVECPIWLGPAWTLLSHEILPLSPGLATVSPSRQASVATAVHRGSTVKVAFMFTHLVSEAWNNTVDPAEAWRQQEWKASYLALQKEVHRINFDLRTSVILAGDMNTGPHLRGSTLTFGPSQIHAYDTNLDHVWVVPANGVSAKAGTPVIQHGHSDHPQAIIPISLG